MADGVQTVKPDPDPTILTTAQLEKAVDNLKELFNARLAALERIAQHNVDRLDHLPSEMREAIGHLQALQDEKFHSIGTQFAERDIRTEQTARDSKVAVDAALQAAKEAVGEQNKSSASAIAKSETATTKQIDAIGILIQTTSAGQSDKIDDLKERIGKVEGSVLQNVGRVRGTGDTVTWVIAGVGAIVAILSVVVAFIALTRPAAGL